MSSETVIPLLPCKELRPVLEFYQAMGFAVTHEQSTPYLYGAAQLGGAHLHFATLAVYGAKNAFGAALIHLDNLQARHQAFADGLRSHYGKVPTADLPRLTRLSADRMRFKTFDPAGNVVIFISRSEGEGNWSYPQEAPSPLAAALEQAVFFRDTYSNDKTAASLLEAGLKRYPDAAPADRARALAAVAELSVALGNTGRAGTAREELRDIPLSPAERTAYRNALEAADALERWISQAQD